MNSRAPARSFECVPGLVLALLASTCSTARAAATMDDFITCGLVYGALFEASKRAGHGGMMQYAQPRMRAVMPYMQENRDNPVAKARLRELAKQLEDEVRYTFVQKATDAMKRSDGDALKASMGRVFQCDRNFGMTSLPLPIEASRVDAPRSDRYSKFLQGIEEGCLARQRSAPSPLPDAMIRTYCACIRGSVAASGLDASATSEELGRVFRGAHPACVAKIQ